MGSGAKCHAKTAHLTRIEKVLEYIHQHLFLPLSLDDIAAKSCWSRWQLQRVFSAATGLNVAQYIRELKLSCAAVTLLDQPNERILDVALAFGFNSEISFSRSFKQFFNCSPREYRKQGIRRSLRQPLALAQFDISTETDKSADPSFTQIRVEYKESFELVGHHGEISGLFASQPNFQTSVPSIWQQFERIGHAQLTMKSVRYGVIDTQSFNAECLRYWAAVPVASGGGVAADTALVDDVLNKGLLAEAPLNPDSIGNPDEQLNILVIPQQHYAVLTHQGPIQGLKSQLEWFISDWLPQSGYRGVDGFELEIYPENYQRHDKTAQMEYWLPIEAAKTHL